MLGAVVWALLTGMITGGVWVSIVLFQRQKRLAQQQRHLIEDLARRSNALDELEQRLTEIEERQDFAERIRGEVGKLPPS